MLVALRIMSNHKKTNAPASASVKIKASWRIPIFPATRTPKMSKTVYVAKRPSVIVHSD